MFPFFPWHPAAHTLCLVDVLPAIRTTQHVLCGLGLHVLTFIVAAVEDHLVGTCATFEAILAGVYLVRRSEFVVFEGGNREHVATRGTDWCMLSAFEEVDTTVGNSELT
jgi:hypothetical protein